MQSSIRDILSDNFLKLAQFNAVVPSQKEMEQVGVEPTTSAPAISERLLLYCLYLKGRKRELRAKPPPPLSADFFPPLHTSDISISFHTQQLCRDIETETQCNLRL